MPSAILETINEKCGIPVPKLKGLWDKAKTQAESIYNLREDSGDFRKLHMVYFKGLLGDSCGKNIEIGFKELNTTRHPIISRIHDLTGIPESILQKHWNTIEEVTTFSYGLTKDSKDYLPTVLKLFQNKINSLGNDYRESLASSFKRAIEGVGSSRVKAPAQKTPPVGINPEALVYWRRIIKTQKRRINSYSDNVEKWAVAIILFKTLCNKRGVAPFLDGGTAKKAAKSPITSFLSSYVEPCIEIIQSIEKFLSERRIVGKRIVKKFKLESIQKEGNVRLINATKSWRLIKAEKAAAVIVYMIPKFGLKKGDKQGVFKKRCGPNASILLSYKKKTDSVLAVTIQLRIRPRMWKSLQDSKKDPEKFMRSWVSRGFKATGAAEAPMPETNEMLIQEHYPADNPEDAAKLINTFTVPALVNLGDEEFQIDLAKYLLSVAKKFEMPSPALLDRFINDTDFRDFVRNEHGAQLPEREDETEGSPEGKLMT